MTKEEYSEEAESVGDKVGEFFRRNIGYMLVICLTGIYIASALFYIDPKGKSVGQILADGSILFALGIIMNSLFGIQGTMQGERDLRVIATNKLHGEILEEIAPDIDKLDGWCAIKNKENYITQRTKMLAKVGLKYNDYFDADGVAKPYTMDKERLENKYTRKEELHRYAIYKKAVNLKLTPLTSNALTSDGERAEDPYFLGRTKQQYAKQRSAKDIASKLVLAVLFGYYGIKAVENFNWLQFLWQAFQIGTLLITGVIKMLDAYQFVTGEYRGRVIKKIDNLQKFQSYIKAEKEKNNEDKEER